MSEKYDPEVIKYKPKMDMLPSPDSADWKNNAIVFQGEVTVMGKCDGEFERLDYADGEAYTRNKYGRRETGATIPAIKEIEKVLKQDRTLKSAVFLCELHVRHNGKLMRVSDCMHYLKGSDLKLREHLALGLFDLVELNGKPICESQAWKLAEMEKMLGKKTKQVYVLPYRVINETSAAKVRKAIEDAWQEFKVRQGYEGLVTYSSDGIGKIKSEYEIDATIVGVNKNDGFHKNQGTSVRLAVMKDEDTFVEIGDVASGITIPMRSMLWDYKKEFPLDETNRTAYVEPLFVVKLVLTDFFEKDMPTWKLVNDKRVDSGLSPAITMRHPRLVEVRRDKSITVSDVGINQISILRGKGKTEEREE